MNRAITSDIDEEKFEPLSSSTAIPSSVERLPGHVFPKIEVEAVSASGSKGGWSITEILGELSGNSSEQQASPAEGLQTPEDIDRIVESLFVGATGQHFEDGMESKFSKELMSVIETYGNDALISIAWLVKNEKMDAEVVSEALRWIGYMDHGPTRNTRRGLLEKCLSSTSARVRDGAALGLAFLDDHRAIASLQKAIKKEKCSELKENLKQVLVQLENTRQCHLS